MMCGVRASSMRKRSLAALGEVEGHVVAQVVERQLGVGRVCDVGVVRLFLGRWPQVLQAAVGVGLVDELRVVNEGAGCADVDAHAHAQQVIDRSHPAGVTPGEVVVDRDQVDALAGQRVQVQGQAGDQRLALTGLHLGDLALVEDEASDQLDVEVPEADRAPACLATQGERLDEELVRVLAVAGALAKLVRPSAQARVVQCLELGLQLVDGGRNRQVALDFPLVRVEELGQIQHGG